MMRRRGGKPTKLLLYLFSKKANIRSNSSNRSLYIALVFAIFFALMIILQILSVEKNNSDFDIDSEGILGRFKLFGKRNDEKEIIFPPKIAQELERIVENAEYSSDSLDLVSTESNQSNLNDYYWELTKRDHWQEVSQSRHKFFVYSAYYDDRNPQNHYIRIIAATKTRTEEKVYCKYWFAQTYPPTIVKAVNKLIRENWNLKYSAYFILCPVSNGSPVADAVSIIIRRPKNNNKVNEEIFMPSNRLIIHNNPKMRNRFNEKSIEQNIAVCVKPLHYEYNKVLNLIEFIELNRILGVKHFVFYNHTIGPDVDCILQEYIDSGIVTIMSWNLNIESQKEIRTEGLFAALNDCLYRTINRFKYVLMIDIDEYIIPYRHPNLLSMLKTVSKMNDYRIGAYSFRNAFFYSQWPDDRSISKTLSYPMTTLLKTKRKTQLNIHKQRSKCIVVPENVVEMGNHFVWEFLPTKLMINIDPKVAFLHHYRVCEFGGDDCIKTNSVIDRRVHFWKEKLINRVATNINKWSKFCNIFNNQSLKVI